MARQIEKFTVYNLRETYHELGVYEFKVVLNQRFFKNSHDSDMTMVDSDGKPMAFSVKKWGRKMNCTFTIDNNVADGVASIRLFLAGKTQDPPVRLTLWVIK
jgi:hypothetical protein